MTLDMIRIETIRGDVMYVNKKYIHTIRPSKNRIAVVAGNDVISIDVTSKCMEYLCFDLAITYEKEVPNE